MLELEPVSGELLEFYVTNKAKFMEIASALGIPEFSESLRLDLLKILKNQQAVDMVEAVTRVGNYADIADHKSLKLAVKKLLAKDGVSLPRGKRPNICLEEFVGNLTPLLLHLGLPLASSERSKLVVAMRLIAEEVSIQGDPRDELRRLLRLNRRLEEQARRVLFDAVARGLQTLRSS